MTSKLSTVALAAFTLLGACAPLSQAGLVYSSRAQVGVNVAGGTPETPGINLNIGMNVGLMPVTGITLPLVSYGLSALWSNLIMVGMLAKGLDSPQLLASRCQPPISVLPRVRRRSGRPR